MKLLIIGGTKFLGRHIVESALSDNHEVTIFHRGKTNPGLFEEVTNIYGDRENLEDLEKLADQNWDAVIDTCGYKPSTVSRSLDVLSGFTKKYVFISTISVYPDFTDVPDLEETAERMILTKEELEQAERKETFDPSLYGPLKAHCEQEVQTRMEDKSIIIRPGLIVGPHDPTDRFTYWPSRVAAGGEVLAPGRKDQQIQFIDARDLAEWIVHLSKTEHTGIFNANGPDNKLTIQKFLETCASTLNEAVTFTWIPAPFLTEEGIQPWKDLPVWIPTDKDFSQDASKAIQCGLKFRPLKETILDTYHWDQHRSNEDRGAGITREQESDVLKKWQRLQEN
ncbi:NAD-dependent epimerase/dehydratase family protein [Halobacillus sp. GSS1]|uniref:NAD-dependent epimerase/dehydratase family protein n=1 Tax=Halobacillus sp. GSS1 TaxID=2815919 RepID=UPI001A8F6FDF|nr:NAD-dependent epimerase/dehydratase family protein [Halobacillus sp. GSS1]MBN9653494.1 NAD-dependent epimerase/dehydratase family protein [Halobacillus sp. GSS1]